MNGIRIWFVEPTEHHNHFGIMAEGGRDHIIAFDMVCARKFSDRDRCSPFHQGSDATWSYWEFWRDMTPEFRKEVQSWVVELLAETIALVKEMGS